MWHTTKKELIGVEPNENDPDTYCCDIQKCINKEVR